MSLQLYGSDNDKNLFQPRKVVGGGPYLQRKDAHEEIVKAEQKTEQKFEELIEKADNVLFKAESLFPLDLFPTKIVISIHKVDVIYNSFLNRRIQPVYIQNISDVFINSGLFLSSLHIIDVGYTNHTLVVGNLHNRDALEAMKIIQGLVVTSKQNIDLTKVNVNNFVEKIRSLGTPSGAY